MSRHLRRAQASKAKKRVKVAPRKYLSEHSVSLYTASFLALPASQLRGAAAMDDVAANIAKNCHIYLICRRPSQSFAPDTLQHANERLSGHLRYRVLGEERREPFSFPLRLVEGAERVSLSEYPHKEVRTLNANDEIVGRLAAFAISPRIIQVPDLVQLEVLYVGQAYAGGRRSAFDRLKSHSTLQEILADMQEKMPDDEAVILTFEYVPYQIISSFDGTATDAISDETDTKRFVSILDNPLTEEQQICLAEAGLIRYFQPEYNEVYKRNFPKNDQKVLNSCYELDFCGLIVEIDTSEVGFRLFSQGRAPDVHHTAQFDLFNTEVRRSFFTFGSGDGAFTMPGVISPS
ncbi:hypothetical protein [Sinorhizobium meliloti]|uniref:hypothetical protein n=1 Tax=Rhizobium meliloti TaxID=382 RepID=UPI000FD2E5C4|nr:hypothetical protein [Sinorhizobium meliloti]RVJ91262.1 hypothetical protein CN173_21665 [Sinorhizobium meliloti]